jgi:hypothetical protein
METSHKWTTAASSPTLDGIRGCIAKFWYTTLERIRLSPIDPSDAKAYTIDGRNPDKFRVVVKGGRYRFEILA